MKNIKVTLIVMFFVILYIIGVSYLSFFIPDKYQGKMIIFSLILPFLVFTLFYFYFSNFKFFLIIYIIIIPITPFFERYLVPFGSKLISILPQLTLITMLLIGILKEKISIKISWVNLFIILWLLINIISLLGSNDINRSFPVFLVGIVGPSLLLFALNNYLLSDRNSFKTVLYAFILSFFCYISLSYILLGSLSDTLTLESVYQGRFGSDIPLGAYSSNDLASYSSMVMPAMLWQINFNKYLNRKIMLVIRIFLIMLFFMLITLLSRGGIILLILYSIIYIYYSIKGNLANRTNRLSRKAINFLLFIFITSLIVYFLNDENYRSMLLGRFNLDQGITYDYLMVTYYDNLRIILWNNSFEIFKENWGFGVGLGNIRYVMLERFGYDFNSHNFILDLMAEQGAFSLILICFIFIFFTAKASWGNKYNTKEDKNQNRSLYLGMLCYFIIGSFLTGSNLVSTEETVAGLGLYWFFTSMSLQIWLNKKKMPINNLKE
jgi:hypothetical protein